MVSVSTGEVINLTRSPEVDAYDITWSPDSRRIAYASKTRGGANYEISLLELATLKVRALTTDTPAELTNYSPRWSPDGEWIAFRRAATSGADSNVYVSSLDGSPILLTDHAGEVNYRLNGWSPDSRYLLVTSNQRGGYDNVATLEVGSKALQFLTDARQRLLGEGSPRTANPSCG